MPLFELFRLAQGKLDSTQDKPNPADSSSGGRGNGFSELAWENGQVVMQGQCSSRDNKSLSLNTDDGAEENGRTSKIRNLSFGLSEFPSTVPSPEIGLNQEDDIAPWMSYPPLSGSLNNDYSTGFLPDLPGVVVNVTTLRNNIRSMSKTDQGQVCRDSSLFSLLQNGSGLEDGSRMKSGNAQLFSSSLPPQSQILPCPSLNLQRKDSGPSINTSSTMNFSCVLRPTAVVRSNYDSGHKICGLSSSGEERVGNWDMNAAVDTTATRNSKPVISGNGLGKGLVPCFGYDLEFLESKSSEEPVSSRKNEAVICEEFMKGKDENFSNQSWRPSGIIGVVANGEKNLVAPGGSSSVCSGNSAERASDDPKHGLKRKSQETVQSDDRSEDVGEELVSAKKETIVRQTPSKRSRTAEVHNLSERRRRDRINEKMRALQELIPNCSKADKASMLDEAIEYVKTLKLQLQMVMMGGGFYVPPMMLQTGMLQHIGHLPFPMGHGMGYGMGMAHMSMQGPHFTAPLMPGFNTMPGSNLHMYGFHGQGLLPRIPMVPFPGRPWMKTSTGPTNAYIEPEAVENHHQVMVSNGKEFDRHSSHNTGSSCLSKQQQSSQSQVIPSGGQPSDKKNNARGASDTEKREKHRPKATCV